MLAEHLYPCRNQVVMTAPVPAARAWEVGALSVDSDVGARELYRIRRPDSRLCLGGARALEPGAVVGSTDDASLNTNVGAYLRRFLGKSVALVLGFVGGKLVAEYFGVEVSTMEIPRLVRSRLFTLVVCTALFRLGASVVFLSALKPPRRVLDSDHLDHTARQHNGSRPTRTVRGTAPPHSPSGFMRLCNDPGNLLGQI